MTLTYKRMVDIVCMHRRRKKIVTQLVLDANTLAILDVWQSGQVLCQNVVRWGPNSDIEGLGRKQSVLQHLYSIQVLARIFRSKLRLHLRAHVASLCAEEADEFLPSWDTIFDCLLFHDHGEGELYAQQGFDLGPEQQDDGMAAVREDAALAARVSQLGDPPAREFIFRSRLQFVPSDKELPDSAPELLRDDQSILRKYYGLEGKIFEAIERYDYLLYAFEHRDDPAVGPKKILKVLFRHVGRLSDLAREIPGFREEIWTHELEHACSAFVAAYEQRPLHENYGETTAADLIG